MRILQWAFVGLLSLATADSNLTHESRNILPSNFKPQQHFRNVNLVRNINLEKNYVRETVNVVIENVDKAAQQEYFLPFEPGSIANVGGLEVRDKKEPEKGGFVAEIAATDAQSPTEFYKIILPAPLEPKAQLTLSITYWTLASLQPLPAQIGQTEKQYVLYAFSAYAPAAYDTQKQKTKLKLPTTDVPDSVTLPKSLNAEGKEDPQKQGTSFTYGPYSDIPAGSIQEASVRYEFTKPLTHSKLLERDVEVSHWGGNVAFEERHWITNRAATLKNHFSRVAYQQAAYYNPPMAALKELRFPLTVGSADAYFIDDIGNVSTSRFRTNLREANLELKPRYPVFGGWNYSFKVGWNGKLDGYVRHLKGESEAYVLKVPFLDGPKQIEGVEYERVVTRVILPEGAANVRFETSVPLISNTTSLHRTFMDTLGRTTLELTAINVVDELRDRELIVTYDYPFSAQFTKPLTIFAGLMAVFVVSWVIGNLDVSIGGKKAA
ncbi:dolichyl-diphosphooligosaccharide--protein glycosyltransferase subunit 1 [Saxophila tyrrhenica]|uniref:Dolichyl-diphosphooligosaccharide--protein glycosyltransferase subunit 1 n=1 Tax=Saxophila tyrrhenica TaxID=1690608 RepID=A0AAV9P8F2_9PEZI|nr:dolichyl-diphosphooligosaccharide--protein glycosyltransferase subunit 1 [Saxophila tyrrhenica]